MADVADQLNSVLGIEIDRRKVEGEALRQLGDHTVTVRLNSEFQPEFMVRIAAEGSNLTEEVEEPVEEAEVAAAEAELEAA
jgi:hypothetical protein